MGPARCCEDFLYSVKAAGSARRAGLAAARFTTLRAAYSRARAARAPRPAG